MRPSKTHLVLPAVAALAAIVIAGSRMGTFTDGISSVTGPAAVTTRGSGADTTATEPSHDALVAMGVLPNVTLTPGATNPLVTPDTIKTTIGVPGWAATQRPPIDAKWRVRVTAVCKRYGYPYDPKAREADHLLPIECGGSPGDVEHQIWPEPLHVNVGGLDEGATSKDLAENATKKAIAIGKIPLRDAQAQMVRDWRVLFVRFVGRFPRYVGR